MASGGGRLSIGARAIAAGAWGWAVIGAACCAAMIPLEPSLLEEGLLLHFATRLLGGEHLYRDLIFFSGPLPFELLAALFRVFGEEVIVGRGALALLHGAATGASFALARRARAGPFSHAVAACLASAPMLLFPLFSTYFYTTLALHLCTLAGYAALRGTRSAGWAAAAGVVVACVVLTKQSIGAVIAPGLLLALGAAASKERRIALCGSMMLGGAATAAATVALFLARGDLAVLVHSIVVMPLALGETFSSGYVNLWPIGAFSDEIRRNQAFYVPHLYNILSDDRAEVGTAVVALTQALYALPFIALLLPIARRIRSGPLPSAVWFQQIVLLALIANLFPRSDWGHLVFALPPAAAQLLIVAGGSRKTGTPSRRVAAGLVVAALAVSALVAGQRLHGLAEPASFGPRVTQRPVSQATRDPGVPRVIDFLRARTAPGEAIFVARAEPLIYFATDTRNPTPYAGVLPNGGEEQQRIIVAALEEVRYVVMSEIDQPLFLYYRDELPAVQAHLERFFRVPAEYRRQPSWILALERAADRGPALVDFFDRRAIGRAWTRDASGALQPSDEPAPVLATRQNRRPLAVVLGARGGGIDFDVDVPDGAVFRADLGMARIRGREGMRRHVVGARLELLVRALGEPEFHTLDSRIVRPPRGGSWIPIQVDLGAYAGRSVTLRLQVVPGKPAPPGAIAWWGSPQLARRGTSPRIR